jgi:hypothetical protein
MVSDKKSLKENASLALLLEEINDHFTSLNTKVDKIIELGSPRKIGTALDGFASPVSPRLKPKNARSKETENEGKQTIEINALDLGNKEHEKSRPH